MKRLLAGAMGGLLFVGGASACEDMHGGGTVLSNAQMPVRGYSYWTDRSPVTVAWENGQVVARVSPDDNGEFTIIVAAPAVPGTYKLVARQDREDSAPVTITVSVVAPDSPEAKALTN